MIRGVIEQYQIKENGLNEKIKITGGNGQVKKYELSRENISPATKALLDDIRQELVGHLQITAKEILDPRIIEELKGRFKIQAKLLFKQKIHSMNSEMEEFLIMTLVKDMLGLGDIEVILNDINLEEIVITSAIEPVRVFHKIYGWMDTNIFLRDEMQIRDYFNTIGRRIGRQITTLYPLLDAHLLTGDRANAVLYPISTKGNTLTIRKFARDPWTITDLIKNKTCDKKLFALLWFAIQYESNILISGGTGSGKTSFLNVCMPFVPPNQRIISIEDTRELMLPEFLYWCPLTTRQSNSEGKGEVTMLDLLVNSLRMRPDRIVLGEMRKQDQAEVLFEAMHTGHSVYATLHAGSVDETIKRLVNPPLNIHPNLLGVVNLNIVMFRNRQKNLRRVYELGEFIIKEEQGKMVAKANVIYSWDQKRDVLITKRKASRLFKEFSLNTGMSKSEIDKDLKKREKVLDWMVRHNLRDIQSVGRVMHNYYIDSENLIKAVDQDVVPKDIEGGKVK